MLPAACEREENEVMRPPRQPRRRYLSPLCSLLLSAVLLTDAGVCEPPVTTSPTWNEKTAHAKWCVTLCRVF